MRSDVELLDAWSEGDDAAGDALVRRHFPAVYRFFAGKLKVGVEDLVQETFLSCVQLRERFRGDSSFRTFLLGIARIQLLRHLRKVGKYRGELLPDQDSVADSGLSPFDVVEIRAEQQILLRALRRIPIDFQIAMELHYWEHMPVAEIAKVTGVATGTVKSRLARGRRMTRREIEKMSLDPALRQSTLQGFDSWAASLRRALHDGGESDRG